jgi:hypothetical protein
MAGVVLAGARWPGQRLDAEEVGGTHSRVAKVGVVIGPKERRISGGR